MRTDPLLIDANFPGAIERSVDIVSTDIDISCSHVPFGFVRVARADLREGETPDTFWAACIASDQLLELLTATVREFPTARLDEIFKVIYDDLARVGCRETIDLPIPDQFLECFTLENACKACCGNLLLLRTKARAFYVHWHRES